MPFVLIIQIEFLQLKLHQAANTIDNEKYDYQSWVQHKLLNEIVFHIPEVVKDGPLAEVDDKITRPLEDMVEALKLVEANLQEYQESIRMDSDFYL